MRARIPTVLCAVILAFIGLRAASAAEAALRVLFLGHNSLHHNSNWYFCILRDALGAEAIRVDYTIAVSDLKEEVLKNYDVLLLYANHPRITPEQMSALSSFVDSGRGFVPVHCASACFGNSAEFVRLVGGRFKSHKAGVFAPRIVFPDHPVTKGLFEYETWDETYVHADHNADARTVLMERADGEEREPWAWVRQQGVGRVFYTASGHDERTWQNGGFLKLLRNGIVWSAGEAKAARWRAAVPSAAP